MSTATTERANTMKKWFVSCIIPGDRQVGAMQFEADEADVQKIAEEMAPCRGEFRAYELEVFDRGLPIGEFVDAETLNRHGYRGPVK